MFSTSLSVRSSVTSVVCEQVVSKTNELILLQIGTSGPPGKG